MNKFNKFIFLLILYIFLIFLVNYFYIKFFKLNVVFYDSLWVCMLACSCTILLMYALKFSRVFSLFENFLIILIFLLWGYSYAISIPTVVDRSLTLYLLKSLEKSSNGLSLDQLRNNVTKNYLEDYRVIETRVNEQIVSGSIYIENNGCITLSRKGRVIVDIVKLYEEFFLRGHDAKLVENSTSFVNLNTDKNSTRECH